MAEERLGRYRILEEIASGTQGAVYRGFDPETTRTVAVKVLHPALTGDQSFLERFRREATLASSIEHPNVVGIFEIAEDDGRQFIALEFIPENLARLIIAMLEEVLWTILCHLYDHKPVNYEFGASVPILLV